MAKQKDLKKSRPLLPQVLCGLALSFMMFIFAPIEMVTLNSTNFWFGVSDFIGVFLVIFAAVFLAIELLYLLLRRLPYALWLLALALLFGVTLGLYIQGMALSMSGEAITTGAPDWPELLFDMLANTLIWLAVIGASVTLCLMKPKVFTSVVSAVSALLIVMQGGVLISLMGGHYDTSELTRIYCTDEEQFTVSPNGDIHVVMLDTYDTRYLDRAMVENPEYTKAFKDFTFYRNTSTCYPLTDTSFPSFLTGELYLNQEPFFSYVRRAFRESRFFPVMIENGMTVQVYSYLTGMFSEEQMGQVANLSVRESVISDYPFFVRTMMCMLGYRYAPMAMHPFMFRDYENAFSTIQEYAPGLGTQSSNKNLIFRRRLLDEGLTVDESRRFFKFHLLQGAHMPLEMNRYGEEAGSGERDQYEQTLGCNRMMQEFFDAMREAGTYDQSTIIIMADHGLNSDQRNGICSPIFLVKYPGETGETMRVSEAPLTLLDMRATALYGAGLPYEEFGTPAHEWEGVTGRERKLYNHKYVEPTGYDYYLRWITEFIVPEHAADLDNYVASGVVYKHEE